MTRLLCIATLAVFGCQSDVTVGSNFLNRADARRLPSCADAVDNDGDTLVDFPFDPGCDAPMDDSEDDPPLPAACSDGVDNDIDTITDFPLEPGCQSAADDDETDPSPLPQCSDGMDNDSDGATDYPDDSSCQSAGGVTETTETS